MNIVQHFFLQTEQRRFMQRLSQMQVGGMEQFHPCYCMTNIRFCKGAEKFPSIKGVIYGNL